MKRIVSFALVCFVIAAFTLLHAQSPVDRLQVKFPDKTWTVVVNSPGFVVKTNVTQKDGRQYLLASNDKVGITLSITLELNPAGADASTCPQYLRKRVEGLRGFGLEDVNYSTMAGMAVAEYLVPEVQGYKLRQKHLVACTAKDSVYIDVHLSKVQFKQEHEQLFVSLINAVSIADAGPSEASHAASARELMLNGSRHFIQQRYKEAIQPYQQALDMEKKQRSLDKNMWRVLVDNLGMAYGITGDVANAEATFQYGLAEEPTYPLFSYNMACVYAERSDLGRALEYLKKAFTYRANLIPGENMPDPKSDSSFERFRNEPKFQTFIASLAE